MQIQKPKTNFINPHESERNSNLKLQSKVREREGDRKMTNGETKKTTFRSGMSDVLSGDIAKSPKKSRTDDLSFHRMNRQASLVPSPKLQHYVPAVFAVAARERDWDLSPVTESRRGRRRL
ncbi:hypothetical protein AT3G24575 [Arabidopsis thaliana]|jgi:hypothetical protein|uniref:Uncharacterized protein n=1 Tax=Arabidopsis thaliana TaxID=3702 RepID=A0A1I9LLB7_ARATH|nr:uncharacterized protein AT3G24575 [Arabidopsis thaliana]ANM63375.1 hypothetical protein AT3G24575 [Arabidopsis thaliana]|eukprot:NP_001325467.1 hypothetical protein AT3G24575 [Arabidopsis thaliana]